VNVNRFLCGESVELHNRRAQLVTVVLLAVHPYGPVRSLTAITGCAPAQGSARNQDRREVVSGWFSWRSELNHECGRRKRRKPSTIEPISSTSPSNLRNPRSMAGVRSDCVHDDPASRSSLPYCLLRRETRLRPSALCVGQRVYRCMLILIRPTIAVQLPTATIGQVNDLRCRPP
jgi:hypothetical protein